MNDNNDLSGWAWDESRQHFVRFVLADTQLLAPGVMATRAESAMAAGYAQGVEVTEARTVKRIDDLLAKISRLEYNLTHEGIRTASQAADDNTKIIAYEAEIASHHEEMGQPCGYKALIDSRAIARKLAEALSDMVGAVHFVADEKNPIDDAARMMAELTDRAQAVLEAAVEANV